MRESVIYPERVCDFREITDVPTNSHSQLDGQLYLASRMHAQQLVRFSGVQTAQAWTKPEQMFQTAGPTPRDIPTNKPLAPPPTNAIAT